MLQSLIASLRGIQADPSAGLGPFTGAIYVALSILGLFIGVVMGMIGEKAFLSRRQGSISLEDEVPSGRVDIRSSLLRAASMAKNVGLKYVIVVVILSVLVYFGMFDLKNLSTPLAKTFLVIPAKIGPEADPNSDFLHSHLNSSPCVGSKSSSGGLDGRDSVNLVTVPLAVMFYLTGTTTDHLRIAASTTLCKRICIIAPLIYRNRINGACPPQNIRITD